MAQPPDDPDWKHWSNMPSVHVAEAVALAQNIDPSSVSVAAINEPSDSKWRKELDEANAGWLDGSLAHAKGHLSEDPNSDFRYVKLAVFADWVQNLPFPWKLPKDFPGWSDVNWKQWSRKDVAEVWQAVALAVGRSPDDMTLEGARTSFGRQFDDMLAVAMSCLGESLEALKPFVWPLEVDLQEFSKQIDVGLPPQERSTIRLASFATWAEGKGYTLPARFPRVKGESQEPSEPVIQLQQPAPEIAKLSPPGEGDAPPTPQQKRKLNNLLLIIATLGREAKYQIEDNPAAAAAAIEKRIAEEFPGRLGVGEDAISGYLREIPAMLANRKKTE